MRLIIALSCALALVACQRVRYDPPPLPERAPVEVVTMDEECRKGDALVCAQLINWWLENGGTRRIEGFGEEICADPESDDVMHECESRCSMERVQQYIAERSMAGEFHDPPSWCER